MNDAGQDFEIALRLRDSGNLAGEIEILSRICQSKTERSATFVVLGQAEWESGSLVEAINSFKHAVEMAQRSEVASLGLFHSLFEAGRTDEAFNEMHRFLSIAESPEYEQLLSDLNAPDDE